MKEQLTKDQSEAWSDYLTARITYDIEHTGEANTALYSELGRITYALSQQEPEPTPIVQAVRKQVG